MRPWTHGITCTGTSCRCSARWRTASPIRVELLVRRRPALEIRAGDLAPDVGERRALRRVVDDDEVPVLRVARRRRLLRETHAVLQHLPLDRPRQVEPLADRARRRKELVGGQLEDHAAIIARGIRSARASRLARRPARVAVRLRATLDRHVPAGAAAALGRFHVGASTVQLTLTACLAGLALGQLVAGPLSDRFGRRAPLLVGIVLYVVSSLLCAVAPSAAALIGLRFVQGIGGAAGIAISRAIARDLYGGDALARFFSTLMLVNGTAPILAPVIGASSCA